MQPRRIPSSCSPTERDLASLVEVLRAVPVRKIACIALAAVVLAWVLLSHQREATAQDWDVARLVELRNEAETLYLQGRYDDSIARYRSLQDLIVDALDRGAIPLAQRAAAFDALEVVDYQLGHNLQGLRRCDEAHELFAALAARTANPDLRAKLAVRSPEAQLCRAEQALERSDDATALTALDQAAEALAALPPPDGLGHDALEVLSEGPQLLAEEDRLRTALLDHRLMTARTALVVERCDETRTAIERATPIARSQAQWTNIANLQRDTDAMCERQALIAQGIDPDAHLRPAPADALPIGPIVLLSVGAAVLAADAVFEGTMVRDDIDRFEDLRDTCRNSGTRCREALDAQDRVDTERAISIAALSVGSAAILGGATWWVVEAVLDSRAERSPTAATGFLAPRADGAVVGMSWTLP